MKMSALRSLVLILAALIFFVRTGLSQESNGFWPLTGEFSAEVTYVGEGDVERGGKHVNDFDEIYSDIHLVLTPRMKLGVLRLGAEWERFSFGLPDGAALPNTIAVLQHDYRNRYAIVRFHSHQSGNSAWPVQFRPRSFVLG